MRYFTDLTSLSNFNITVFHLSILDSGSSFMFIKSLVPQFCELLIIRNLNKKPKIKRPVFEFSPISGQYFLGVELFREKKLVKCNIKKMVPHSSLSSTPHPNQRPG